jgi:hypothetical protein
LLNSDSRSMEEESTPHTIQLIEKMKKKFTKGPAIASPKTLVQTRSRKLAMDYLKPPFTASPASPASPAPPKQTKKQPP